MKTQQPASPTNTSPVRRQIITTGAAAAAISGFPAIIHAQSDKIRIGHLTPQTGFLGTVGEYAVLGIKMAVEELNKSGGLLGREIELLSEDSIYPATASSKAQRQLERDGAVRIEPTRLVVLSMRQARR